MATILVTGANGKVSSETLRALKDSGHKLIGLVRDKAKGAELAARGVELRVGDLDRLRTVEDAFSGVDTLFILTPPGPLAAYHSSAALWAGRRAGVKHVLRMSAVGAAHDAPSLNGRVHALSDAELERSGIAYTIIKPHFFTQNLLMAAKSIVEQGMLYWAFGDARQPIIDVRDVADSAAAILRDPARHAGKTYTLTSGTAVTLHELASAIGDAVGKKVTYVPVPVGAMVETMAGMGLDDFTQVSMRDYLTNYSSGWQSTPTPAVAEITGKAPRTIQDFARDFAGAFGKK